MSDARLRELAFEIDQHNTRAEDLVKKIRQSAHPKATAIADALDEECVILASAVMVVDAQLET